MKGLGQSKRFLNHDQPGESSQENKGETSNALVDDAKDDDGEGVESEHASLRKSATEGIFFLADLNRLALNPGLTTQELANGFWNLRGRIEQFHPSDKDTFVNNIIFGKNLEVFLEVDKSLSFGKGMILQLMYAAVRVGDEDAVVRLVSLLHRRRYNKVFDALREALKIDLPYEAPHSGVRGVVKEIVRLKIVKPGHKVVTTTYSCKDFIENFNVLSCSKQALIAIDEVLGPQVWGVVRCDKAIAAESKDPIWFNPENLARNGVLEYLLRHNALVLTPKLCTYISKCERAPPLYMDSPHTLSLIDYCSEAGFTILEAQKERMLSVICDDIRYGRMNRLHNLLEFLVPAESSCTMREDGLLDEPRPPQHIVEMRAKMVLDAICTQDEWHGPTTLSAHIVPIQHYLFHELQLDIEQVFKYCKFDVIYLGPTTPPTFVDEVLQIVQANVPRFDIDKWKELFKHDVYPVPAYYGDQGVQSSAADKMKKFRKSLRYYRTNTKKYFSHGTIYTGSQTRETLEYLRPWFRVFSEVLSEETKFSMSEAVELCSPRRSWSDFRAQVMLETDMIRISDELRGEWYQQIETHGYLPCLSTSHFPLYLKWYEYTKDRKLMKVLQVVVFATACVANRISEAKRVVLDMLQPPSGQDPWAQVSRSRAYLLTMAACTRNLPFVKWVFSQIQAAFPLERNHQLTIPAWLAFMTDLIPIDEDMRFRAPWTKVYFYGQFMHFTNFLLNPPCPKYFMETGLLLAQADPLAVLPLIFRIIIMKQQRIFDWAPHGRSFYDSPREEHNACDDYNDDYNDDDNDDDKVWKRDLNGTNPAWAWGPITLVKLIELIADETTGTAYTILNAKEQLKGIGVAGSRAFSLDRDDYDYLYDYDQYEYDDYEDNEDEDRDDDDVDYYY